MPTVKRIKKAVPAIPHKKRVAAYARVSRDSERLLHSLSAQVSYYSSLIQNNPDWEYAGVYADEGITGTLIRRRDEFIRMIDDCDKGKIDIIITKSIQRFARNALDLLETVRHLKDIGVEVRFERENINTLSGDGELMLSILASVAQEEVRNLSDNVRWARQKKMKQGELPIRVQVTGYTWEGDKLVIEPEGASLVRRIFSLYLDGKSPGQISKILEEDGIKSIRGTKLWVQSIYKILRNVLYKGDLLLQKTVIIDPISKVRKDNDGILDSYYVENDHPAIIEPEIFDAVQEEMKRRKDAWLAFDFDFEGSRIFTRKIKCGFCGCSMAHSPTQGSGFGGDGSWYCITKDCNHGGLPDLAARQACNRALGTTVFDEDRVKKEIRQIRLTGQGRMEVELTDGTIHEDVWYSLEEETPRLPNNARYHPLAGKIVCGMCGCDYRTYTRIRKGVRLVQWNCKGYDNSYIPENILRRRVCEATGMEEFSYERFNEVIDRIVMDRPCHMEIHMKDGSIKEAEYFAIEQRRWRHGKESKNDSGEDKQD